MSEREVLLLTRNLTKEYELKNNFGIRKRQVVHAVSNVSIEIYKGETLSLVGESGCGKSTLGRMMMRLIEPTNGQILFGGKDITVLSEKQMNQIYKKIQLIFQDPYASLDPRMKVKDLIGEPLVTHRMYPTKEETEARVRELMHMVGIRPELIDRYPHQFSGGQRQRIGIARALALKPELIVCDEPVSALDVSIQSQILNLLKDLQQEFDLTYLFISHDLGVVHYISDRICVMFLGKVCEIGDTEEIYTNPMHPYTRFLLDAVPSMDPEKKQKRENILSGEIPSAVNPPSGCRFRTRCPYAKDICAEKEPELKEYQGRKVACHFPLGT
ncbi:MAG: dipeptide ABC transporter ATP-binding protein [Hungatella sp.]|nr:dipeptide ABC transporter ATP-binding protein [Hungatella sp.]